MTTLSATSMHSLFGVPSVLYGSLKRICQLFLLNTKWQTECKSRMLWSSFSTSSVFSESDLQKNPRIERI